MELMEMEEMLQPILNHGEFHIRLIKIGKFSAKIVGWDLVLREM